MTLDTNILIVRPHAVTEVRDFVNSHLLNLPVAVPMDTEFWEQSYPGRKYFGNAGGQGLDAWFMGYTAGDGPVAAERYVGEDSDGHEITEVVAEGSMMLSFDTGYGYKSAGAGCSDLHAYFIGELAHKFGPVWWQNEFTGEWFTYDRGTECELEHLEKLGDPQHGKYAVEAGR